MAVGAESGSEQTVPCRSHDWSTEKAVPATGVLPAACDGVGQTRSLKGGVALVFHIKVLLGSVSKCCSCVPLVAR